MNDDSIIRIILVDDHDMVRRGLSVFLEAFDDFKLVGEARTGQEALEVCAACQPDVVLMDLVIPEMDGVTAISLIRQNHPDTQVIALTSFDDEARVEAAIKAGAIGYLLKNVSIDKLAQAIRAAYAGEPTLAPEATKALIAATRHESPLSEPLTGREQDVLALMAEGLTNPLIAGRLMISRATVKTHVSNILVKLRVTNRLAAVAKALEHDLIDGLDD
jgi:NarL family two-component system response regulator LiaR